MTALLTAVLRATGTALDGAIVAHMLATGRSERAGGVVTYDAVDDEALAGELCVCARLVRARVHALCAQTLLVMQECHGKLLVSINPHAHEAVGRRLHALQSRDAEPAYTCAHCAEAYDAAAAAAAFFLCQSGHELTPVGAVSQELRAFVAELDALLPAAAAQTVRVMYPDVAVPLAEAAPRCAR
jgi:hypothetical protein